MSDPIADMLTRIRNGIRSGQADVDVPASSLKENMCVVLKREGFIKDFVLTDVQGAPHNMIRITLKYGPDNSPVITGLRRISKPSLRTYASYKKLPMVRSGLGIAIVSTSRGIMTGKEARAQRVGGEVLCEVW